MLCARNKIISKISNKTIGVNSVSPSANSFLAAALLSSSLVIKLGVYSTQYLASLQTNTPVKSVKQNSIQQSTNQHILTLVKSKQQFTATQKKPAAPTCKSR